MVKLSSFLITILAIEVLMKLFLGVTTPITSLFELVLNPHNWSLLNFISDTNNWLGLAAIGGIVIGSYWSKGDFLVFAGIAIVFFSYGQIFAQLHTTLSTMINVHSEMGSGDIISFFIVAPLIILYIYTILKFWRGND